MVDWKQIIDFTVQYPFIKTLILLIILFVVLNLLISIVRSFLMERVTRKKQKSSVEIFSRVTRVIVFIFLLIFAVSSYESSWAGLGLGLGLFSAALGWALQKPITGIAAWVMIVLRRPFEIGDRVIIGTVKGDVIDITLTHIYLNEIGGIIAGEENSGRIILVPNSTLFEQNIINYTSKDDFVLDQVPMVITYESNLDQAMQIALEAAKKELKEFDQKTKKPYVRTLLKDSGVEVRIRYFVPATRLLEFSSRITQEILREIKKSKSVELAYPHTEIIFKDKK